jgi:serine/threonine-protein kinase ULK/ATG1
MWPEADLAPSRSPRLHLHPHFRPRPLTPSSSPHVDYDCTSTFATQSKPGQAIAIKAVSRQKLTAKLLENLESEINILKAISHRNIVSLEDCFVSRLTMVESPVM